MRILALTLVFISCFLAQAVAQAAELMLPVPVTDAAYGQLRQLIRNGLLIDGRERLLDERNPRELTRYDIAFMLVEPLERCSALADVLDTRKPSAVLPEQRRRAEMACCLFARLTHAETDSAIASLGQLVHVFGTDIDQLSPGLTRRAAKALQQFNQADPASRPWEKTLRRTSEQPVIRLSIAAHEPDSLNDPWLFSFPTRSTLTPLASLRPASAMDSGTGAALMGTRSMSSLAAAADIAFDRYKFYVNLSTLPGGDPTAALLNPDGTGRAKFGVEIGLAHVNGLGISGIFEYHIMRTGDDTNHDTNVGAMTGIGLTW